MNDKKLILDKLKKLYKFKTDTEFANFLGIKQNTLSNWRTRNTIDYDLILSKCDDLNANWLHTGEGNMLKHSEVNEDTAPYTSQNIQTRIHILENRFDELQKDVQALTRTIKLLKKE